VNGLRIDASDSLWGAPVAFSIHGAVPHGCVDVSLTLSDDEGVTWCSQARYVADGQGTVRPAIDAATCSLSDANAPVQDGRLLLWAMAPQVPQLSTYLGGTASVFGRPLFNNAAPVPHTVSAVDARGQPAQARFHRHVLGPGASAHPVADGPVCGLYFEARRAPHRPGPAVLVIPGSNGGADTLFGPAYASAGLPALSMALFRYPGRPAFHEALALEDVRDAARWLAQRSGRKVVVQGSSRGAEAALLAAIHFPQDFAAAALLVPGSVDTGGYSPATGGNAASWTLGGLPLPHWRDPSPDYTGLPLAERLAMPPVSLEPYYADVFRDAAAVAHAGLPVERLQVPLLMLSAGDDRLWPSALGAEQLLLRMLAAQPQAQAQHLCLPGAGHGLAPPGWPTSLSTSLLHRVERVMYAVGGTPQRNASAADAAWRALLTFAKGAALA
jgi:dienelactone hydrolase